MSQDSGTHKYKRDDLTRDAEKENSARDSFTEEEIEKLSDLFSTEDSLEVEEDTGEMRPFRGDDTGPIGPPKE